MMALLSLMLSLLPRLLLVVAIAFAYHYVRTQGVQAGRAEVQAKWDQAQIAQLGSDREDLKWAIARTVALGGQLQHIQATNEKGHADAKRASQTLLADLRTGALRLSVPASPAAAHVPGTGADSATAGPVQARTELDPSTGANLVAITDDGDGGIRDLNTCIEAYNAVRAQVNGAAASGASP